MLLTDVDYLIVGAGLSGLTLHHFLRAGSVAILDPNPAHYKLGESLVPEHFRDPALAPLLEEVQRLPSVSPKRGSLYIGDDSVASFPLPPADFPRAMHLRREELEERMISLWQTPIERERVKSVDFDARLVHTDKRTWRVAKQVIDCSGIARVLSRLLNTDYELWPSHSSWIYLDIRRVVDERFHQFLEETGRSYARYDPGIGHRLPTTEYEGWSPSNCTIVRRLRPGMFAWQIPLYQKSILSFGITSRHGPISLPDIEEIAKSAVAPCYEVDPRPIDGSSQYNRFHVYNRFSRGSTQVASDRWILVGDAAFFGEPIYATGTAVAVNQALFIARALNDGGWTREKADEYTTRWGHLVQTSTEARKYFFSAEPSESAAPARYEDRGQEGTPFQLTMLQNYGTILWGLKQFVPGDDSFGSRYLNSPEEHARTTANVRTLLSADDTLIGEWTLVEAYSSMGGLQLSWVHPSRPELIVRVEPARPGRRAFQIVGRLALAYKNLPDGPYPMDEVSRALMEYVAASLRSRETEWTALLPAATATSGARIQLTG